MKTIQSFLKKEPVLSIAAVLALGSAFLVPPSAAYMGYIDCHVLALLFCLMAVVAGLMNEGFFDWISQKLLSKTDKAKTIGILLVNLCFFAISGYETKCFHLTSKSMIFLCKCINIFESITACSTNIKYGRGFFAGLFDCVLIQ